MAKQALTLKNVGGGLKRPAKIAGGIIIGAIADRFLAQKIIGKSEDSGTASGIAGMLGLSGESTKNSKRFLAPAIVAVSGAALYISTNEETIKDVALGIGAAGVCDLTLQAFQGKSLTTGFSGSDDEDSFLGSIFGADEDIDGFEGDDDEYDDLDGDDDDLDDLDGDDDDDDLDGDDDDDDDDDDGVHGIGELPARPSLLAIGSGNDDLELEGGIEGDFGFDEDDII